MFRLILSVIFGAIFLTSSAQYAYHYTPLVVNITEDLETMRLNNIRFDDKALSQNSEAYHSYKNFLSQQDYLAQQRRKWGNVCWAGFATECFALIPLFSYLNSEDDYDGYSSYDSNLSWAIGIGSVGLITCLTGYIKWDIYNKKIKEHKKDFIYYLKTTHNGLGVVVIF